MQIHTYTLYNTLIPIAQKPNFIYRIDAYIDKNAAIYTFLNLGIIIRFLGEANTTWSETKKITDQHGKEQEETETLTGHEEYYQIQYYLLGGKNSKNWCQDIWANCGNIILYIYTSAIHPGAEIELPQGTHTYPFTCALPPQLPSSFEGEWGHVRYTIKITLDRPWKFDQDTKMAFTVISPVDLNQNPRIKVR